MQEPLQTVQTFVAPVVVISANGLLALALYNRLAALIGRSRTINKERFDLSARLSGPSSPPEASGEAAHLRKRIHVLDELGHQLFSRGRLIRDALLSLMAAVLCMLGCSLALGLASLWDPLGWAALILFVAGILVMAAGVIKAVQELRVALSPLLFEHDMMEAADPIEPGEENGISESP
jgi:hypothetical protein